MKIVTVQCISCGNKKKNKRDEDSKSEFPICDKCGMIMIAVKAEKERQRIDN